MKTTNILLPLLAASLLAVGCTKEYVNKYYEETIIQGTELTLIDFDVRASDWGIEGVAYGYDDEGFFWVKREIPEIDDQVIQDGFVQVHVLGSNDYWSPLPTTRTEKTENDIYFTTYVDYEYAKGVLFIYVTASDLYLNNGPGDMHFRVAITTIPAQ